MSRWLSLLTFLIMITGCTTINNNDDEKIMSESLSAEISNKLLEESYFFPIGTVVELKNISELIFIIGLYPQGPDGLEYVFQGITYPGGFTNENEMIYFNPSDIEKAVFLGFVSTNHILIEQEMQEKNVGLNGERFFVEGYVGYAGYKSEKLTEEEAEEILNQIEYFPLGTVFEFDDETQCVIVGYYPKLYETGEVRDYAIILTPVGTSYGTLRTYYFEDLKKLNLVHLGYMDSWYYALVDALTEYHQSNK